MNDNLWKNFENTGSINAYLTYRGVSYQKETNSNGKDIGNGDRARGRSDRGI